MDIVLWFDRLNELADRWASYLVVETCLLVGCPRGC